mmetsp:Transcript_118320/g.235683  ORF Transcript_118320/g.235683 Transcript_118320/m.235683 type:complete len:205 (+) Transcript_118320:1342-1956(+)
MSAACTAQKGLIELLSESPASGASAYTENMSMSSEDPNCHSPKSCFTACKSSSASSSCPSTDISANSANPRAVEASSHSETSSTDSSQQSRSDSQSLLAFSIKPSAASKSFSECLPTSTCTASSSPKEAAGCNPDNSVAKEPLGAGRRRGRDLGDAALRRSSSKSSCCHSAHPSYSWPFFPHGVSNIHNFTGPQPFVSLQTPKA